MIRLLYHVAALGILVVSFSIAYYLVIFLPSKENTKQQYLEDNRALLEKCLADEAQTSSSNTEKLAKMKRDGKITDLFSALDEEEKTYQMRKADCFKKYPQ